MLSYIKTKLRNLRIKIFLWLMGEENHNMWYRLQARDRLIDDQTNHWGSIGKYSMLGSDSVLHPSNMYLEEYTRIQDHLNFISYKGKLRLKKYAVISAGSIVIPGDHVPTVGVPQYLLGKMHINDVDGEIIVEEDAWVGAGTILLSHCKIGRGAIVAAGSVVSKPIPPYAVVAGVPAKIIATKFSIEQILEHEAQLYPKEERMSREELEKLFDENYKGKRAIGRSTMSAEDKERVDTEKARIGILVHE